jgi:hypothetical protein
MIILSVFYTHRYRYSLDQCHMDPTINKVVLGEIRTKIQNDKKTMFESVVAEEKRLLQMV